VWPIYLPHLALVGRELVQQAIVLDARDYGASVAVEEVVAASHVRVVNIPALEVARRVVDVRPIRSITPEEVQISPIFDRRGTRRRSII
jgi:hypothetical protein